jgi:hypothetical protein
MEAQWVADRLHLRNLLTTQPDWTLQDLAEALGRSRGWVKKWKKRLHAAPPQDEQVLHSQSRARKHPPPCLSPLVVDHILAIRDAPPQNLKRIPGPRAIRYYLEQEATTTRPGLRLPRSTRTIWRILRQYQRIRDPIPRVHHPTTLPPPLSSWQIDFLDASSVRADPEGKQLHVVETLNTVDVGTSILLDAQVRPDFTMATAIEARAATSQANGLPDQITFDRDARFVGSTQHRDCPSPFLRLWHCLGVHVTICPPRRPDLNGFVERYHRAYDQECLQVYRPADCESVQTVTAAFRQHYNDERPHQGQACGNRPPRVAFTDLPARPGVPPLVDPNHWIDVLPGQRYVRKVQRDTSVTIDTVRYYTSQTVVGKYVILRLDASDRTFVVEHEGQEIKRLPIQGTSRGPLPFAAFVEQLCAEARANRSAAGPYITQLAFPFG